MNVASGDAPTRAVRWKRSAFHALGAVALILGILSTGWLVGMVDQWLIPWSSLSLTAPPR